MKPYFRVFLKFLSINDCFQQQRIQYGLEEFNALIKQHSVYYKATEYCTNFIFKAASRLPLVLK